MSRLLLHRRGISDSAVSSSAVDLFPATMPIGNIAGNGFTWQQIFTDNFTTYPDLPVGSFDPAGTGFLKSTCAAYPYMGNTWTFYPDGGNTTHGEKVYPILSTEPGYIAPGQPGYPANHLPVHTRYYPTKSLSIVSLGGGEKAMQIFQHTETIAGVDYAIGANMKPVNPAGTYKFDPYYRTQFWMRANPVNVDGADQAALGNFTTGTDNRFHWVPLGIDSSNWPGNGELDFPEGSTNRRVRMNYHPASTVNETFAVATASPVSPYQWNLFTQEWMPGRVKWWVNQELVLNTTDRVPTGPLAFQFQHEADWRQPPPGDATVQIKWFAMWKYV